MGCREEQTHPKHGQAINGLSKTKVGDLHNGRHVFGEKDVLRFEVTVSDPLTVDVLRTKSTKALKVHGKVTHRQRVAELISDMPGLSLVCKFLLVIVVSQPNNVLRPFLARM